MKLSGGFVQMRRGIMQHLYEGEMTPMEFLAFVLVVLLADKATGVWRGSNPALVTISGEQLSASTVKDVMAKLEAKGYILRGYVRGKRSNFPILIDKYLCTVGAHNGERVDLVATKKAHSIPDGEFTDLTRTGITSVILEACSHPVYAREPDGSSERIPESEPDSIPEGSPVSIPQYLKSSIPQKDRSFVQPASASAPLSSGVGTSVFNLVSRFQAISKQELSLLDFNWFQKLLDQGYSEAEIAEVMEYTMTRHTFWSGQIQTPEFFLPQVLREVSP